MTSSSVDPRRLDGRVAVVTGAAGGIGGAVALELAALGAALVLTDQHESALQPICARVEAESGLRPLAIACDLTDSDAIKSAALEAEQRCGRIDVLVANAGVLRPAANIEDIDLADWDLTMSVNLRAPFLCARFFGAPMLRAGGGSIVMIGSIAAELPNTTAAYGPSKAGLVALVRQIAVEWGPRGVRANAVSPGLVRTPLSEHLYADPVLSAQRMATVPLGRPAHPPEIARVVGFLAGEGAAYVTGQNVVVDGAITINGLRSTGLRPDERR